MKAAARIIGLFAVAIVMTGCGSNDVVSPTVQPGPKASDLADDIARAPTDTSFHETVRYSIHGTRSAAGGCHFMLNHDVPAHQMRRSRIVEVRKSTCDGVVIARNDPYLLAMASGLAPSHASFSLSPSDARQDLSSIDPSESGSTDATYGSITPTTLGSGFAVLTAIHLIGGDWETRDQVTMSYAKANGCIQSVHAKNFAQWKTTRSDFGWDIDEFQWPTFSGDACGIFTTYGYAKMIATNPDPGSSCGYGLQMYTSFNVWLSIRVSDHQNFSGAGPDFYTGSCEMWPEFISGTS